MSVFDRWFNVRALALAATVWWWAAPSPAHAQATLVPGVAIDAFDPAVPGDAFFGVPSPSIGGHLVPRGSLLFDFSLYPFAYELGNDTYYPVKSQGTLHAAVSLALWDRLLVSVDAPIALANAGEDPGNPSLDFHPPSKPAFGDLRLGARGRLWGAFDDPFQISLGANVYLPTGSPGAYTSDGHVRILGQVLMGGRARLGIDWVWSAMGGFMGPVGGAPLLTFGGGLGAVFWRDRLQIGPEIYGSTAFGDRYPAPLPPGPQAEVELLGDARVRVVGGLFVGFAGGRRFLKTLGSPALRLVASIGWAPLPSRERAAEVQPALGDRDGDGVRDDVDACPDEPGVTQADPAKDGCPIADKDKDGVPDVEDACPGESGPKSPDPTKNGCPADSDGDGVADGVDACPKVPGVKSVEAKKNGCPSDRDRDGIPDDQDACPDAAGVESADAKQSGCPEDPDGDGIKGSADACPLEKGTYNPDPKKNGCPMVRLDAEEIAVSVQIQFKSSGVSKSETVAPVSEGLLREIRDAIERHPEVTKIEVQGHTDDVGTEAYNQELSQRRAEAVRRWLIDAGVPAEKLVAKGYGVWRPVADNRIRQGRTKNRRVQFVIIERSK